LTDPARTVRWGILGPGRISVRVVRATAASERSALVAVASRDLARAEAYASEHGIPTAYGSYDELLASPDVDAVYIAVPNHRHAELTVQALEAGKHVLCEKPLAMSVAEVDAIIAASERTGRIAAEAFMALHHPQIRRAVELAQGGDLGDLQVVIGTFSFLLDYPDDPRVDPDKGGGSLWDVGCYPVNITRRIAGEDPDRVTAFARFDERGVDRTFIGQLHFPSGLLAQFDSGFAAADRERLEVVGSAGRLVLDSPFLAEPDGPPAGLTLWRGTTAEHLDVEQVDQVRLEVDDLVSAILDGTPTHLPLAFSRGGIATLVELDRAARANAEVG
jgi:predicted dehydrogenase